MTPCKPQVQTTINVQQYYCCITTVNVEDYNICTICMHRSACTQCFLLNHQAFNDSQSQLHSQSHTVTTQKESNNRRKRRELFNVLQQSLVIGFKQLLGESKTFRNMSSMQFQMVIHTAKREPPTPPPICHLCTKRNYYVTVYLYTDCVPVNLILTE